MEPSDTMSDIMKPTTTQTIQAPVFCSGNAQTVLLDRISTGAFVLEAAMYCECGCGQKTKIATYSSKKYGYVKGRHFRFVTGHNPRSAGKKGPYKKIYHNGTSNGEHRAVVENAMGKVLPPGAVVHHHDGNGRKNNSDNLVACEDQAYHLLLHLRERALKACGHATWMKCRYCKTFDNPVAMYVEPNQHQAYHYGCKNKAQREQRRRKANDK